MCNVAADRVGKKAQQPAKQTNKQQQQQPKNTDTKCV